MTDDAISWFISNQRVEDETKLLELPPSFTTTHDWSGNLLSGAISWHLASDPLRWFFGASSHCGPPHCDDSIPTGTFKEGLWNTDVAELFVLNSDTGSYREWNLGPQGAWWAADFESYRKPAGEQFSALELGVRTRIFRDSSGWSAVLSGVSYKAAALREDLKLHFSAIVGRVQQTFATSAPNPSGEPDFHKPSVFRPVRFVTL